MRLMDGLFVGRAKELCNVDEVTFSGDQVRSVGATGDIITG